MISIKKTFEDATKQHNNEKATMKTKMADHMANMVKMKKLEIELTNFKTKAQQECNDAMAQAMVYKQQVHSLNSIKKYDLNFIPQVTKFMMKKNAKKNQREIVNSEYSGGMIKKRPAVVAQN